MNSFFGLGPMELLVIVFLALIVLGPQRLPGTIREVMKWWHYFRNLSSELTSQLGAEFKDLEDLSPQKILEDLAKELDTEVEQTKEAASLKKKTTPKVNETKPAASKPKVDKPAATEKPAAIEASASGAEIAAAATTAAVSQATGSDTIEPKIIEPETVEQDVAGSELAESELAEPELEQLATATAETAEAPAGESGSDEGVEAIDGGEAVVEDKDIVATQSQGSTGDVQVESGAEDAVPTVAEEPVEMAAPVEDVVEPAGPASEEVSVSAPETIPENTILPPNDRVEAVLDGTSRADGAASTEPAVEESASEPTASSTAGDEVQPTNGQEESLAQKPIERVEPAPRSVNGKGTHPEDEA
jgi:sec-independent protein translocase protein TatB